MILVSLLYSSSYRTFIPNPGIHCKHRNMYLININYHLTVKVNERVDHRGGEPRSFILVGKVLQKFVQDVHTQSRHTLQAQKYATH